MKMTRSAAYNCFIHIGEVLKFEPTAIFKNIHIHLKEKERKRRVETAACSHECKNSQQRMPFQVVLSLKQQIAANCCNIVAHLWTY